MFHPVSCLSTKLTGNITKACRCEKKTPPKWGKEPKETIKLYKESSGPCEYCVRCSRIYNHHCSGCRGRLIMSTHPERKLAQVMIEYLHRSVRIDKKQLSEEAKQWKSTVLDANIHD